MNKKFIQLLFALLVGAVAASAGAQAVPSVTLDQAVQQVQSDTGGKVLSAEPRHIGRRSEYRIKVLTPTGHVRVMVIPAQSRNAPAAQSGKNPPVRRAGSKEKR
jgi:hypothetical protein